MNFIFPNYTLSIWHIRRGQHSVRTLFRNEIERGQGKNVRSHHHRYFHYQRYLCAFPRQRKTDAFPSALRPFDVYGAHQYVYDGVFFPARQAAFFRHLFPEQKRFGLLVSPETRSQAGQYRQAFSNAGLILDIEDADTDKSLLPALNAVLERSSALLALPDSTLYRRNNIKAILITAFRQQRPIIGYSPAFVTAGALAALHTTPHQVARQTADLIIANGTNLPPPSGPTQFAIAINPNVAQALGLKVPDEAAIRRALLSDRESR